MIKLLSVAIVAALFLESHQRRPIGPVDPEDPKELQCWTDWFDRDDPSGSGDWENFSNLYRENPGKICPKPQGIEATTLSGLSVAAVGEVIFK
ncbi:hypothetical protein OYC64_005028 [Pagothenia borchgrevinki]|uniref:WxxW domain-containing protein n=1 Tax=Pagothenia borchgrevinki TaxID=8213 RepID=A0ABD2GE79_PAGBO